MLLMVAVTWSSRLLVASEQLLSGVDALGHGNLRSVFNAIDTTSTPFRLE